MTKRMLAVLLGIVAMMLFLVIPELLTGMSIIDAFLSSMGFNVSVMIDFTPPYVEIIIPEPITYPVETVTLEYNITDTLSPISTIWYNIDYGTNVTITSFVTITIPEGEHILYLYANDTAGNINFSYVVFNTTTPVELPSGEKGVSGGPSGIFEEPKKNITEVPAELPIAPPEEKVPEEFPAEIKVTLSKGYKFWYTLLIILAIIIYLALYIKKRKEEKEKKRVLKKLVKRRGGTE